MILVPHDEYAWFSVLYRVILKLLAFIGGRWSDSRIWNTIVGKVGQKSLSIVSNKKEPLDNFSKSLPLSHTIRLRTILVCIEACINAQHWKKRTFMSPMDYLFSTRRSHLTAISLNTWLVNIYTHRNFCSQIDFYFDPPELGRIDVNFM